MGLGSRAAGANDKGKHICDKCGTGFSNAAALAKHQNHGSMATPCRGR